MNSEFERVPTSESWVKIEPVNKGYSSDKKYHVWANDGSEYLLRISELSMLEQKQDTFALLRQLEALDVPASRPVAIGSLDENRMYLLLTWLEGVDAKEYLCSVSDTEAYRLGYRGGQILKRIQQVKAPPCKEIWAEAYQHRLDDRIKETEECQFDLPKTDVLAAYIRKNRHLVPIRPSVYMHGDYHVGNMIVDPNGKLGIIDFDRMKMADPYREFKCFQWNVLVSPHFASGLIDGYFDGNVPENFFPLLALFTAEGLVHYVNWSAPWGEEELSFAKENYRKNLEWFDDFRRVVPTWYIGKSKNEACRLV